MTEPGSIPSEHWNGVWERADPDSVSWFQTETTRSLRLIETATGARPRHDGPAVAVTVVDVGGGASRLVDALILRGLRVTVLDIAKAALERSRRRLGDRAADVSWVVADITRWKPECRFDVWHDRAVFHFLVEPADRQAYRECAERAVRAGGVLVLATFAADGPEQCSGLTVRRYSAADLTAEFHPAFELEASETEDHETPWGTRQAFTYVVLRRRTD